MAFHAIKNTSSKRQALKPHAAQSAADSTSALTKPAEVKASIENSANLSDSAEKPKRGRPSKKLKLKQEEESKNEKVMVTMRFEKGLYVALVDVAKSLSEQKIVSVQAVLQQLAEDCVRKSKRKSI